ncbi:MAG TPA: ATP-binding protein [Gemmataceae bacterium]|nr:ATP-binding protein [Gemmataceae bacterium]
MMRESKANVLLVDDTPANLLALRTILDTLGQNLVEALSGEEALRHLLHDDFAVILLDVSLPGMDGYEVARMIRGHKRCQRTPIIFVTAYETPSERMIEAYSQGAVDFLVKPLVPVVLRSKVAVFVELFQKSEQLKRQQEQMLSQQREMMRAGHLAVAGQLAAGVAHEVRNPLATIKVLVEGALRTKNAAPLSRQELTVMHGEIARLERIVQDYLDFARPPELNRSRGDLREVIDQAAALLQANARRQGVRLQIDYPSQPVWAQVDHDQLRAVLVNLLINAIEAMPRGGPLKISLTSANQEIELTVTDTGAGIPPDILKNLFTPFVSGKPTGTGLGLCISKRIVEYHGGRITAKNHPEGGAVVTIKLPQTAKPFTTESTDNTEKRQKNNVRS